MSETERVKFHLLPKDYAVLASLAEEVEIGVGEFCRQLAEVRAATEREGLPPVLGAAEEVEVMDAEQLGTGVNGKPVRREPTTRLMAKPNSRSVSC